MIKRDKNVRLNWKTLFLQIQTPFSLEINSLINISLYFFFETLTIVMVSVKEVKVNFAAQVKS